MARNGVMLRMRNWGSVGGIYPCCPGHDRTTGKGIKIWRRKIRRAEERRWVREWRDAS